MEHTDEIKRLKGCINDLISVLALPAIWSDHEPSHIVSTLLDALLGMLRLDFAYARLSGSIDGLPIEMVRLAQRRNLAAQPQEVGRALNRWLTGDPPILPLVVPNPIGGGEVSIAPFRLGLQDEVGVLVAGSQRADFPTKIEMLLLRVAANQAAIGVQEARLLSEQRRAAQEIRLLLTIMQAIDESEDFHSALAVALRKVCEATDWAYGEAWIPRADGSVLDFSPARCQCKEGLEEFRKLSEGFTFAPGAGLPGRVWASKQPEWVRDVSIAPDKMFFRVELAMKAGLKAALGIPIIADDQVLAVLVFFMFESREEDKRLMDIVSAVATQLGSLIQRKGAEQALRESEERLQAIIDTSTRLIFVKDTQGRYILVNRQYEKLLNRTREQIQGRTVYDLFPKETADRLWEDDLKVLKTGAPLEFEEIVPLDDGIHTYIANRFPLYDSEGIVYAICGIATDITERKQTAEAIRRARDELEIAVQVRTAELTKSNEALQAEITERKRAEEGLQKSEREFRMVIDNVPALISYVSSDQHYRLVNKGYEERFGLPRTQIVGKNVKELLGEEAYELLRDHIETVLSGRPVFFESTLPFRFGGMRWMGVSYIPDFDDQGRVNGFFVLANDITDRKRTEDALRRTEAELRRVMDSVSDYLWSAEVDGRGRFTYRYYSPVVEGVTGRPPEFYMQGPERWLSTVYAEDRPRLEKAFTRITMGQSDHEEEEYRIVLPDGTIRWVRDSANAKRLEDGTIRLHGVVSDNTERKKAEIEKAKLQEQLIESERLAAVGATAAKLAHEIANPLNGMYMSAQLLERRLARLGNAADETVKSAVRNLMDEVGRLNHLLHDFSSIYRREKYKFQPTSLGVIVGEVFATQMAEYDARGIRVEQCLPADLSPIVADRNKLKQALLNLAKNAVEAMPQGGTLTLRAYNSDRGVVLEIGDTGIGIPAGVDIFAPFTTTKSSGTGLGLMIIRQTVSAHGGTISYESEPGKGTVFQLTLPLRPSPQ